MTTEHRPSCPRSQFWDAGEWEAPCTCDTVPPARSGWEGDDRMPAPESAEEMKRWANEHGVPLSGPDGEN